MKRTWIGLLVLVACGSDPDYVIPPTTKIADEATKSALIAVNADGSLEFSKSTGVLDSLDVGDILNSNITEVAPYGLLRKITAIHKSGGHVTLDTVQGTLGEAIERGSFEFQRPISVTDIPKIQGSTGNAPIVTFDRGIRIGFDDNETNYSTPGDVSVSGSLVLNGNLRFNPIFSMHGEVRNFHVESFDVSLEFEGDSDLAIDAAISGSISKDTEIYAFPLTAITIPIGPFVIVLVPVLHFKVGVGGSVALSISFHETGAYDGVSGTRYDDGHGWTSLNHGSSSGTIDSLPSGSVSAEIDAWVGVEAEVLLYDAVGSGPVFYVKTGPSLDFSTPRDPFLQAGLRLVAGLSLQLSAFGTAFGSTTLVEYNELFPILTSSNTPPSLAITSPGNNLSFAASVPVHFQAAVYDLEDGTGVPVTWTSDLDGEIGTGSDFTATLHPTAPGLRTITVTAVDSAGMPRSVSFQLTITNAGSVPTIAEPRASQALYTYDSVVRGSATSPFFPGADVCSAGFVFDWASTGGDTIGPIHCSLGSARAVITYAGNGPRTLTFGVTDPFGVRTTTTRIANVTDSPAQFIGSTGFSTPAPSSSYTAGSTVMVNATADPRKVVTDPPPFVLAVPLTFTFTATSYAADGTTELATIDLGSKVETDKLTVGTGATPALSWIPGSTPGFIDPTIAAMGTGQHVVISVTVVDGIGHLGTAVQPILVTP